MDTIKLNNPNTRLFLQRENKTHKTIDQFYLGSGGPSRVENDDRTWNPLSDPTGKYEKMTPGERINFSGQTYLVRIV